MIWIYIYYVTFKINVIFSIIIIILNIDELFITILKSSLIFSKPIVMDILLVST